MLLDPLVSYPWGVSPSPSALKLVSMASQSWNPSGLCPRDRHKLGASYPLPASSQEQGPLNLLTEAR